MTTSIALSARLRSLWFPSLSAVLIALFPSLASAHAASATITCLEVSFSFKFFPLAGTNTVNETVTVDSVVAAKYTYKFIGSVASNNLAINVPVGTHTVVATADWDSNGATSSYTTTQVVNCSCAASIPDMSSAVADGSAFVASVKLLGTQLLRPAAPSSSSQVGPGTDTDSAGALAKINLAGPIQIELLQSSSTSTVASTGATDESIATTGAINLLNKVSATALRADARAFASPVDARYSFAGSGIDNLNVGGVAIQSIYPNETLPLPGGGTVTLLETTGTSSTDDGVAKADLVVNLIHIRIPAVIVRGVVVAKASEIIVGHAEAHAESPLATLCPGSARGSVSAEAFAAKATQGLAPSLNTIWVNRITIPSNGGTNSVALQTFKVTNAKGTPIGSGTVFEQVNGSTTTSSASATANATVQTLCLLTTTPCEPTFGLYPTDGIALNAATAAANSDAGGGQASSYTAGTTIATLVINGKTYNPAALPPNSTYTIPGVATLIVNEQIGEDTNNNETDNGVTVNLLHLRLLIGGADIIVGSAHSDAHHQ